jgi:hypothetical protein
VTVACKLQRIDINSRRHENIRVKWDKIDKEQYRILLEENMKDIAQIVQTKEDKPRVDKFVNSLSNVQYFFTLRLFSTK